MPLEDAQRLVVKLSREQHEWLRARAFQERVSIASVVRELIDAARGASGETRPVRR